MAFNGQWLIKVGSYPIPLEFMKYGTYKSAPAQRQDNDSYVDADGYLHRTPMPHTREKMEFETVPLPMYKFRQLIDGITANYINGLERKVHCTYYEEEYDQYVEGDFYLPGTMEFTMLNKRIYDSNRFAFIEY